MQKNVLNTDLTGKVAVVTGAGGVLCSYFAKVLARAGAKVALLDLNFDAANQFAEEITAEGGIAKAYSCNVLDKDICYTAKAFGSGIGSQLSREFKGTFDAYIDEYVHPDDQAEMRRLLSAYQIRKSMTESSHLVRREYHRRHGDQYQEAAIILQAARFENGTVRDVVIALRKYTGKILEM